MKTLVRIVVVFMSLPIVLPVAVVRIVLSAVIVGWELGEDFLHWLLKDA